MGRSPAPRRASSVSFGFWLLGAEGASSTRSARESSARRVSAERSPSAPSTERARSGESAASGGAGQRARATASACSGQTSRQLVSRPTAISAESKCAGSPSRRSQPRSSVASTAHARGSPRESTCSQVEREPSPCVRLTMARRACSSSARPCGSCAPEVGAAVKPAAGWVACAGAEDGAAGEGAASWAEARRPPAPFAAAAAPGGVLAAVPLEESPRLAERRRGESCEASREGEGMAAPFQGDTAGAGAKDGRPRPRPRGAAPPPSKANGSGPA